jgi:hypothetical protein
MSLQGALFVSRYIGIPDELLVAWTHLALKRSDGKAQHETSHRDTTSILDRRISNEKVVIAMLPVLLKAHESPASPSHAKHPCRHSVASARSPSVGKMRPAM